MDGDKAISFTSTQPDGIFKGMWRSDTIFVMPIKILRFMFAFRLLYENLSG